VKYLVSGAVDSRRSVVATSDNLGVSSPASLPATGRSIPRIRPLRGEAWVTSLVLPGTRRPPGALREVLSGRVGPAGSAVIAEASVASIAVTLSSASHDANWRTDFNRRPVTDEIAVPVSAVGQVGPVVLPKRRDGAGVLGCSPWLALETEARRVRARAAAREDAACRQGVVAS
jgi:hypothetical protein